METPLKILVSVSDNIISLFYNQNRAAYLISYKWNFHHIPISAPEKVTTSKTPSTKRDIPLILFDSFSILHYVFIFANSPYFIAFFFFILHHSIFCDIFDSFCWLKMFPLSQLWLFSFAVLGKTSNSEKFKVLGKAMENLLFSHIARCGIRY